MLGLRQLGRWFHPSLTHDIPGLTETTSWRRCPSRMSLCRPGRRFTSYDAPGKTVAVILRKRNDRVLMVENVTLSGFVLNGMSEFVGSMILFPHTFFSWNVTTASDLTPESFSMFKVLDPKIDLLVFGYGARKDLKPETRNMFVKTCKDLDIRYEILPTHQAVGVYNFLATDHRYVAAALIPPSQHSPLPFVRPKGLSIEELDREVEKEQEALTVGDSPEVKRLT